MFFKHIWSVLLFCFGVASCYNGQVTISTMAWAELNNALDGSVTLPTDESYASDYVLWTATYDHIYPEAIVKLASENDASLVMKFLLEYGVDDTNAMVDISARNCGHSLAGWSTSTGIIIDSSGINHLYVSEDGTGMVGPGVDLYTFTTFAEENDFTLPHGDCSSVCFGGFLLGGGFGLTSRTFGLGIDWIKSINIVLPTTGELVTVSNDEDNEYSDLFWALRGGGQGNFGLVTSFEMNIPEKKQTHPGLYVEILWDFNEETYAAVAKSWNEHVNNEKYGNHFAMYLRLTPTSWLSLDYTVGLHGFWTGEQVDGLMVLAKILDEIDETPTSAKIDYVPFEGWIDHSATDRTRYSSHCSSRFAFNSFNTEFFNQLQQSTSEMQSFNDYDSTDDDESTYGIPSLFLFVAPAGGAISHYSSDETVFPWRKAKYFFNVCVRWMNDYDNVKAYAEDWLIELMNNLESNGHLSDKSFVNFPDNNIENWSNAYYGDNYDKLREIKAKYDPYNYFSYAHSIVSINENDADAQERQIAQTLEEKPSGYVTIIDKWLEKQEESEAAQQQQQEILKFNVETTTTRHNNNTLPMWVYYVIAGALVSILAIMLIAIVKNKIFHHEYSKLSEYTPLQRRERGTPMTVM